MSHSLQAIRIAKVLLDLAVLACAFCLAFVLRFEEEIPAPLLHLMASVLPVLLVVKLAWLRFFGVGKLAWRYVGLFEAQRIFLALVMASLTLVVGLECVSQIFLDGKRIPRGAMLMDLPFSFLGLVALRVGWRACLERIRRKYLPHRGERPKVPTLLIGAGRAGSLAAKMLAAGHNLGIRPLGFVDGHKRCIGMVINGIPIVGTITELGSLIRKHGARQVLITLENVSGEEIRRIANLCNEHGVPAKIIPNLHAFMAGEGLLAPIRDVAIEDVLRREPVQLDHKAIAAFVRGQRVLVTGAGGSIGSELCRLICRLGPETLILVEKGENNLFHIHRELAPSFSSLIPYVADICDEARLEQIFAKERPTVVLHAAAHKHVPLMEANPGEAIKNNIVGTRGLADMAHAYGVKSFVMISTDKAVNPTSAMGVSKRIAEIYIQALAQQSQTRFVTVRFGNVLGSAGSVIPIFREQIALGGPVTITHPEMQRYFMTIPEACNLVLQAASLGRGGEIFILDMGKPVKIVDLARDLIRLSGLEPDRDVLISFTGIRPGEKLFEELSLQEESVEKTRHPKIFVGRLRPQDLAVISSQVESLVELAGAADFRRIHTKFKEIVPEYQHAPVHAPRIRDLRKDEPHTVLRCPVSVSTVEPLVLIPVAEAI